jgi:hypothetical protein
MIQNGMTIGAASEYDAAAAFGERLADAIEARVDRMMNGTDGGDGSEVEEAISENADLVRVAVMELIADSSRGAEIAQRLESMIRAYVTPSVMRDAERDAMWGD